MEIFTRGFSSRRRSILRSDSQFSHKLQLFLNSPLANWVKTFEALLETGSGGDAPYMEVKTAGRRDCQAEYLKLADGAFLNGVMRQIDPTPQSQRVYHNEGIDEILRTKNLTILTQHIKTFYQEDLQQLILMPLPNVQLLGRDPLSDEGLQELENLLLLLLGCAVQCERKEEFIGRIQTLDLDTQASVAGHIQEITQNQKNMVALHWPDLSSFPLEDLELLFQNMAKHLKDLVNQRDDNMERIAELSQERESQQALGAGTFEGTSCHRTGENRQHLTVQLADHKSKCRRLRQELEEKTEQLQDCKQQLQELEGDYKRLQKQNRELILEVRTARTYRDEVDILREKATRVDRLQSEVKAYKERLNSIEFYRGKAEEEREYSQALLETKAMLEEQLEAARSRCDQLHELEKENLLLRSGLQDLEMERETDRQKIEELLEENLCLEMELKKSLGESLQLSGRAETVSEELPHFEITQKPLSYEVHEATTNQLLRLERENQDLRRREEQLRLDNANADTSTSVRILGLERENQQLQRTVERLQAQVDDESQNMQHVEGLSVDLLKEKERLERTLQTLQENRDREVEQLKFENEHLSQTVNSLRQRSQVSAEVRAKDVEQENRILHEAIMETSLKQSKLESERRQALEALEQCRARADKAEQLEQELGRLDRLNGQLRKQVLDLEVGRQRALLLEERASGLEAENGRLQKSSESLGMRLEALEMENAHLDQENLQLRKGMEMQAVDRAILSQLEVDNKELGKERDQLRKTVNQQKASIQRAEELQSAHQRLEAESQRLTRSLENARGRVSELEMEAEALEMEVQSKQRDLEEQRAAAGNLEQDRQALEQELELARKEKRQLAKEYRRLQQQAEIREASLDEHNLKVARLVQENRQLLLEDKRTKETLNKLREVEVENGELLHQLALHRKEAGCLREELMTEKLKTQELSNELDNLSHKLERMGLEQGQPLLGEHSAQESNYKLLELKLESVFKETLRIRDTHIASLSSQLEEVGRRNQEQSEQLRELKWNLEQTQPQEEVADKMADPPRVAERPAEGKLERRESIRDPVSERLIEVERNNATLLAEKGALEGQLRQLKAQNDNLQAQILALQKQNDSLQALSAKLQVENGSLATQSASLAAQSSHLESKQASLEAQWAALAKEYQGVQDGHRALVRDHEKLAQLHESLEAEFEGLVEKHGALKGSYKSLEAEHKELEGRYSQLVARKVGLEELEAALRIRQEALEKDAGKRQDLGEAYQRLKDEHDRLNQSHADCGRQRDELGAQHRALKSQLSMLQLEKARAEAESNVLKDHSQQLEIRWSKLSSQCELLNQLKGNLEEENRHLLHQIKSLTEDNRILLEKTVESKDQFHEEQRQYMDKLNELRREKQKLVEKIMDQYRVIDPAMPRRKGNWITDKMKKLIKPRKELSKDQLRPIFINPGGGLDDAEASVHLCQPDNSEQLQTPSKPSVGSDTLSRQSNSSVQDVPPAAEKVLVRTRRKLSSRIYSSETPRQKFRQRRVGWYATENEEGDEETDSLPSCSSTVSRDSDPTLDNKEVTGSLEPNKETGNKNSEPSIISDSTEGSESKEEES